MALSRTRSTLLLLLAVFGVFAASATKKEDRDGYFHTMDTVSVVDYEPMTVFDGLLPLPEWAVWVCEAFGLRLPPRTPKAAHHDAPVSTRAPIHLPRRLHKVNRDLERGGAADSDQGEMVVGEWLVMVGKSHRDDFVAVLEDMGDHLNKHFGMAEEGTWFDVDAMRASKQAHEQLQRRRHAEGQEEQRPWKVQAETQDGHVAFELDKRMLVKVVVPAALHQRQYQIVDSLRDKEWTEFIEPNLVMRTTATQTLTSSASNYAWGIDRIDQRDLPLNAEYVYSNPTYGVRVYVVDTGIRTTHEEFEGRASWGINTVGDGKDYDCHGHGTHVAGIVVGRSLGVAKDVEVVAVKSLGCDGSGTSATVSLGINYAINNCPSDNKCIISLSLGGDTSLTLESLVKDAYDSGLVVVSAAGNANIDACDVSPARSPYGITVGASTQDDEKAFFSNWGSCVNIWAPGTGIPSAYYSSNTTYTKLSGTSQATPHVTGAVALFWGAIKNCTPSEAAGAVYASATLNRLTGTDSETPNRLLYSQVNGGVVLQTAASACTSTSCELINGILSADISSAIAYVPTVGPIAVDSATARYGYFQAWLEATADFDLRLEFYSGATWAAVATSSSGSGSEWMQFATSATGAGQYRFVIVAPLGQTGTYRFSYQVPSSAQVGLAKTGGAASAVTPFWLPLIRDLLF